MSTFCNWKISQKWAPKLEELAQNPQNGHFSHFWSLLEGLYKCGAQKVRISSQQYTLEWLKKLVSRPFRLWQNLTLYSEVEPIFEKNSYFGGFQAPRGPRGVQVDPRWFQTIGTMSHTMPQPSQVALWALKSQNWEKIGPNCPKNSHFGVYFGGFKLPGPPYAFKLV